MKTVILITLLYLSISRAEYIIKADIFEENQNDSYPNLGAAFNIKGLIEGYGYPFEEHTVTTSDGYILKIHRIKYSQDNSTNTDGRPPVLVMHGLLSSSADFFHIGVGNSLPLRLADVGYDVWVGNNRGNTWGREHTTMRPNLNATFWNFSMHELGTQDTPAIIDYVLKASGAKKLSYVGHSVGATQFFILASTKPEYNDKVNVMAALAPIVYIGHSSSPLLRLINKSRYIIILAIEEYLGITKLGELLQHDGLMAFVLENFCKDSKYQEICTALIFLIEGFDSSELNRTLIPQFLKTFPGGVAIKEVNHFLQLRISGDFRQFDYGIIGNMEIYNNHTPPSYNLSKVTVPVGVFYAQNDLIVNIQDINQLTSELPNVIHKHEIEYPQFNHFDFLIAKDVDYYANFHIINTLNPFNGIDPIPTTSTETPTTPAPESTTGGPQSTPKSSSTVVIPSFFAVLIQVFFFYCRLLI